MAQESSSQVEFQELIQELAAGLVLANPGDLSTFQPVFRALEAMEQHPLASHEPHLRPLIKEIREKVESCIMGGNSLQGLMPELEAGIQKISSHQSLETLQNPSPDSASPARPFQEAPTKIIEESAAPGEESISDPELLREFLSEARENLDSIEVEILALEENPSDLEVIHRIFRPFHTIKGVSGFLNLHQVHSLSHKVEDVLDRARNGTLAMTQEVIDMVLEAVDLLKALLSAIERQGAGEPCEDCSQRVQDFLERLADLETEEKVLPEEENLPPLGEILVATRKASSQDISQALEVQVSQAPDRPLGEILVEQGKVAPQDVHRALKVQQAIAQVSEESRSSTGTSGIIRVDMAKLDNLVDMVGELVIAQSLIRQNPRIQEAMDHRLSKDFGHLGRITSELQRTAMSMRMVPIKNTFQKMIRLVRDLSRKSGKAVQLVMSGEETEIDRNMVDAIHDPLVHMIRNSVDHGIEPPETRQQRGKPPVGTIQLKAYHKGGHVIIEIQDDGGGLDLEKILNKAREKGLLRAEDTPSDHEIYQLIFHPGFSTAERITDVSGRGVGMDVVKKAIEKLRGRIELFSKPGQGCTIVVKLPLTLAIIDGMIVRVGTERYIIPTMNIRETFQPEEGSISTVHGRGELIRVRDRLLPLMRLHKLFAIPTARIKASEALGIVVDNEGECWCVLVDQVLGKQEVVIKSLGEGLKRSQGVSGGAILGDGRVALILDIAGLLSLGQGKEQDALES